MSDKQRPIALSPDVNPKIPFTAENIYKKTDVFDLDVTRVGN